MAKNTRNSNPWVSFITVIVVSVFFAAWLLLPEQSIHEVVELERAQMLQLAGKPASDWIDTSAAKFKQDLSKEILGIDQIEMNKDFRGWLIDRAYVSLRWYEVFVYRMFSAVIWFFVLFPIFMAASSDGYYAREIRKSMFTSQSPLRLRIGSVFSMMSMVMMIAWLLIPISLPAIIAPFLILSMAFSCWMWTANLQKRI